MYVGNDRRARAVTPVPICSRATSCVQKGALCFRDTIRIMSWSPARCPHGRSRSGSLPRTSRDAADGDVGHRTVRTDAMAASRHGREIAFGSYVKNSGDRRPYPRVLALSRSRSAGASVRVEWLLWVGFWRKLSKKRRSSPSRSRKPSPRSCWQNSSQNVGGTNSLPDRRTCLREWPTRRGRSTAPVAQSRLTSTSCEIGNHCFFSQAVRRATGRCAQASAGCVPPLRREPVPPKPLLQESPRDRTYLLGSSRQKLSCGRST